MNFFEALSYPFRQRGWFKQVGPAVLVAMIPIAGFFIIKGWEFEISVRVRHGTPRLLPGWGNLFDKLARGFLIRLAEFLYNIPTFVLLGIGIVLWARLLVRFFSQDMLTFDVFTQMLMADLPVRVGVLLAAGLYWLVANILYWAGYIRYIDTRRFGAFFEVFENVGLVFRNIIPDLIMAVYVAALSLVLGLLGSLLGGGLASTGLGAALVPILVPGLILTIMALFKGYLFGRLTILTLDAHGRV